MVYENWKDSPKSVLDIYEELIPAGIRIWVFRFFLMIFFSTKFIYLLNASSSVWDGTDLVFLFHLFNYSGDTDAVIPVTSTRYSIDALKLQPISPWRPWYSDGQVGGWTQEYEGLNFVTVRGAGHEVPLHRPKEALALFNCFISGSSMPKLQQITDS